MSVGLRVLVLCILSFWGLLDSARVVSKTFSTKRDIHFFSEQYGVANPEDFSQAYAVFDKVLSVADVNHRYWPSLVIINDHRNPTIIVLDSGHIVVSVKALELLYKDVSPALGNTRLAFVLGHELSHLAADSFWESHDVWALYGKEQQKEQNNAGGETQDYAKVKDSMNQANAYKDEIYADEQGFLFAALAGYPVDKLLEGIESREDFFSFWANATQIQNNKHYPSPADRSRLLIAKLKDSLPAIEYFNYGVRLASFGRYQEAIKFFHEFQKTYPHREVFLNLGFCYLQMAFDLIKSSPITLYWLPPVADTYTPFSDLVGRVEDGKSNNTRGYGSNVNKDRVQRYLKRAIVFLENSVDKDSQYSPAHYNLALAWYYMDQLSQLDDGQLLTAQQSILKAERIDPNSKNIQILKAAILTRLYPRSDFSRSALTSLDERFSNGNLRAEDAYNMSLLHEGNADISKKYWRWMEQKASALPPDIYRYICRNQHYFESSSLDCDAPSKAPSQNFTGTLPVTMWRDLLEKPFSEAELSRFSWQETLVSDFKVYENDAYSLLAVDDIVAFQVLKLEGIQQSGLLDRCCPDVGYTVNTANGHLVIYDGWIAVYRDNQLYQIWVAR